MPTRKHTGLEGVDRILATKRRARVPFEFVLDALEPLAPQTRAMFGSIAVYVGERIVLILRDRETGRSDNGVWVATTADHHASLRAEFPSMRSIRVFGPGESGWQVIPVDGAEFEREVDGVCTCVLARDPRIGKIPKPRRSRAQKRPSSRRSPRGPSRR